MITAQTEPWSKAVGEMRVLFPLHWQKLSLNKDIPLDPNYAAYAAHEQAGRLLCVALRDQGRLIGYWVSVIAPGLHYQSTLTAIMDMWYVLPEYESGTASLSLMRAVEKEYTRRNVARAFAGEKNHLPCGRLYEAFGYRPIETIYSKVYRP